VVVANAADHVGGMDEIRGESDQRAMDLGNEYDPNGDGKGMDDDQESNVIDVVAIEHKRLQSELNDAFQKGYIAAETGLPESACPIMDGDLCIAWVKGWKEYQRETNSEWWQQYGDKGDLGGEAA